ncbi:hypothetical protein BCS42_05080 [Crenothrix sp. D3]|nr:hypothetical protein BCS42_05080 [Crenothrix sp. D3]
MKLTLIWWNTSLAPLSDTPASDEQLNIICRVVEGFVNDGQADFIALGEINDCYFDYLEQNTIINGFRWFNLAKKYSRISFDSCVLVREDKLQVLETQDITVSKATSTAKIAQKIIVAVKNYDKPVQFFISHWASRLHTENLDRVHLGIRLRDEVSAILKSDDVAPVILLGDYNDEPFSDSLTTGLEATRDITRARKNTFLLYNPFWRHLGETQHYQRGEDATIKNRCGSYYYKSGSITRWHTFDQMIFSACFVGGGDWHLNEISTGIINTPELFNRVMDNKQKFDHLPIISVLEKEISHD